MKYKLIIFDWDGTLMDSIPKIVHCLKLSALQVGLPEPTTNEAAAVIGLSLDVAIAALFPEQENYWTELVTGYQANYKASDSIQPVMFDGTAKLLSDLRDQGLLLAVATGKSRQGLNRVLDESQLCDYFITSRTADEAHSKPAPDMLKQILNEVGIDASSALMVGDSLLDMTMASNANMDAVAMSWGAADKLSLSASKALTICDSYVQLRQVICS
ncbi:HAD-IA family hydrolase [Pseudoalteromonas sp. MMG012]|uniref:HAD-IA family hydrolase n=1 Tax=Pseudoalteromonas sp. MMG012 TaxID=2822686 RepID=UPI001B39D10F|nr:HAD-IA family hydrolase [Pseudoalteromonas sp. MMG012]MBQ4850037.1 HAD-IA family hydrolase [Pseudoalteromonas sp. MMG012]